MAKEKRKFFRVKVKQLTSIVRIDDGSYELVRQSDKVLKKQIDIMKELGFSTLEFKLLKEASANSDGLIATEDQAMKTIKQGRVVDGPLKPNPNETPQQFALRIVFDERYHGEVSKIMKPVRV